MMSLESFHRLLKAEKVPYYAYPKCEPTNIFEKYKFGLISGVRKISTDGSSKFSRKEEHYRIDKKVQQRIWNQIIRQCVSKIPPYIIAISSSVNDYLAHEVTAMLLLAILRNSKIPSGLPTWKWFTPNWNPSLVQGSLRPDIVVIRSIMPDIQRNCRVRDILDYYYNSLRIVVLGGINGIDYFDNQLFHPLSGAIHIEGYKGPALKDLWVRDEQQHVLDDTEYRYPIFTLDDEARSIMQSFKRK